MKYKCYFAAITTAMLLLTGCQQTQNSAPEQSSTAQTSAAEQVSTTQTAAAQTTTEQSNAQTPTEPPVTDNTPLTDIVRSEQIRLPDDISRFVQAERTEDGFGCIAYNKAKQLIYLHISEDMQTSEAFVLAPLADEGEYYNGRQWFAIGEDGIWAIVQTEKSDSADKKRQYLLCHYAKNGDLLSALPAKGLQDEQMADYRLGGAFESVGDVLYLTPHDGRVLQIGKETAEVSAVSDLYREDDSYNVKYLCFDRDDKPVLLREKVESAPDTQTIHEASVCEFDLASGSCGQTIHTTGDNRDSKKYCFVMKGFGEYRLFINTGTELTGIRDDGTEETLIDFDASELDGIDGALMDCLQPPYSISDIMIVPGDDTHFLGHILNSPDYRTEAYRLTRKHESEIG